LEDLRAVPEGGCLAIGMFDGVHRGHQMLIDKAVQRARASGMRSVVLTFSQHPLTLLAPPYAPKALSSPDEKAHLIERLGVDVCLMLEFTRGFAALEPC